ncbi:MAG: preprotein translocase subunit SecG [Clostridia bacterium]|nr:preprotein translocase subunit SecG [Clostridia bacterium]
MKSTILAIASDFATNVLPVIRYVLFGIIIACAAVLVVTTLLQSNDSSNGMDALTGVKQESYYSQNKGASRDAILKRITIAMAIVIVVCVLAFFITELVAGYEA